MNSVLQAFTLGVVVGTVFGLFRQPVPAPSTLAGVMGVVGLFVGWTLIAYMLGRN